MKKIISILVCSLFLVVSCEKSSLNEEKNSDSVSSIDGKEVFKAAFFNLGEKAKNIPSLEDNIKLLEKEGLKNSDFLINYETSVNHYVKEVELRNPDYFIQLGQAVESQNFSKIKDAMEFGTTMLAPIVMLNTLEDIDDDKIKNDIIQLKIEDINFHDAQEIKLATKSIIDILDKHGYSDSNNLEINIGRCFYLAAAVAVVVAAVGNFVYGVNLAVQGNLAYSINRIYTRSKNSSSERDNFGNEKMIKEMAFAFH